MFGFRMVLSEEGKIRRKIEFLQNKFCKGINVLGEKSLCKYVGKGMMKMMKLLVIKLKLIKKLLKYRTLIKILITKKNKFIYTIST